MNKDVISTPNAPAAVGPYSQGIRVGDIFFLSGQIPLDPATGKLVSTKKTATTEIGNNRTCNVSGQVLDSTGIPVPMGLGVTLKFSK